ncbi:putative ferric reductase [Sagittula marina]|uniref:Putative ferric reductase n=1 Tax=Sagittula marina TaxID=943940 RepID=A0A7W6GQT7_9RHOB|nr:ferric reductase-like transmembrane domain-containing protein [Sagittula marina]MBB3983957.1 putative ferric reductase [Sagittula marina]
MQQRFLIWLALVTAIGGPLVVAATSPLLAWRQPIYIVAGLAGVLALGALLIQPMLLTGALPGVVPFRARQVHRWIGWGLIACVALHIAGLWITSPPDVVDALLYTSATPFSARGVTAMWALLAAALLTLWRHRLGPRVFRPAHSVAVVLVVITSILHAVRVDGTMGTASKWMLCALVLCATASALVQRKPWRMLKRR